MATSQPWLIGIVACPLDADADAVRAELRRRGLRTRSVPGGRARAAWTCEAPAGTLAVVVSGRGAEAAGRSASFWIGRTRRVVLTGAGIGTGLVPAGTVVTAGDTGRLASAAPEQDAPAAPGRVATVAEPPATDAGLQSLRRAGYAVLDGEIGSWGEAVATVDGVLGVCRAVLPEDAVPAERALRPGQAGPPWWRRPLPLRRDRPPAPGDGAREAAARCAVTALLGPS